MLFLQQPLALLLLSTCVVGWIVASRDIHILILGTYKCTLYGKRDSADVIKDLRVGRLSSLIQVDTECNHLLKGRQREIWLEGRRRQRDGGCRDCSYMATSQACSLRTQKRQGMNSVLELTGQAQPCWYLDFSSVIVIWDFCPPSLWENKLVLLYATNVW